MYPSLAKLRSFVTVAEYRHFRKASEALGLSQPALSLQIRDLEQQLGVVLVDAAFVVEPYLSVGVDTHRVQIVGWPYGDVQKRIPISQFAAMQSYIDAHPDVIERFVRGYNRGVDWVNQHERKPEWYNLISSYTHIDADKLHNIAAPVFSKTISAKQLDQVVMLMKKNGLLKGDIDINSILYKTVLMPPS